MGNGGLGERIRQARKALRLTQEGLAARVDMATDTIARYERGEREPEASDLVRIAAALDVSAGHLLGEDRELEAWEALLHESSSIRGIMREIVELSEEERAKILRIAGDPLARRRIARILNLLDEPQP